MRVSPDIDCPSWIKMLPISCRKLYASAPKIIARAMAMMLPAAARLKCGESGGEENLARSQACSNDSSSGGMNGLACAAANVSVATRGSSAGGSGATGVPGGFGAVRKSAELAGVYGASLFVGTAGADSTGLAGITGAGETTGALASPAGFKNAEDPAAGFCGSAEFAEESGNSRLAVNGSFESDIFSDVRAKIVGFFCAGKLFSVTFVSGKFLSGLLFSETFFFTTVWGKARGAGFCSGTLAAGVASAGRCG